MTWDNIVSNIVPFFFFFTEIPLDPESDSTEMETNVYITLYLFCPQCSDTKCFSETHWTTWQKQIKICKISSVLMLVEIFLRKWLFFITFFRSVKRLQQFLKLAERLTKSHRFLCSWYSLPLLALPHSWSRHLHMWHLPHVVLLHGQSWNNDVIILKGSGSCTLWAW